MANVRQPVISYSCLMVTTALAVFVMEILTTWIYEGQAVWATSGDHITDWVSNHMPKTNRFALGAWNKQTDGHTDRQTDGQTGGSQHHLMPPTNLEARLNSAVAHWRVSKQNAIQRTVRTSIRSTSPCAELRNRNCHKRPRHWSFSAAGIIKGRKRWT